MGACVSTHKGQESDMKLRLSFRAKHDKLIIPSPVKEKPAAVAASHQPPAVVVGGSTVADVVLKSQQSPARPNGVYRDLASKDENFYDSQAWLESDCEDDFYSVNGDFTPSRGNTPVHHSFPRGANRPLVSVVPAASPIRAPPPEKKKRLSDLFKESMRRNRDLDSENVNENPPKTTEELTYVSQVDSRLHREGANGEEKETPIQCCLLPRSVHSRSSNERKKKTRPPPRHG